MRRFFFIFTAWGLLLTFSVNSVLASNLPSVPTPERARASAPIPSDLGKVLYQGSGTAGRPAVYLIQDAHSIVGAQRSIQGMLDLLTRQEKVSLVALEGASGLLAADLLRAYPDLARLKDVLWKEAEEGTLSGSEIESVLGPGTAEFRGIEKRDVYEKNFEAFRKAYQALESYRPSLDECAAGLKELIHKQFSADLKRSWELRENFNAGSLSLLAYLEGMIALAGAPPASFPALDRMTGVISEEKRAERDQEIAQWIRSAFDRLAKSDRTALSFLRQRFDTSQISRSDLIRELRARLEGRGELGEKERVMLSFIATQEEIDRISGTDFMQEFAAWTNSLEDKWTGRDPALRETLAQEKRFRIVEHYLTLELTREEWLEIRKDPGSFTSESFGKFLGGKRLFWDLGPAQEFYRLVTARDRIFSKTLQSLIREKRPTAVAVVTGGFHTDPLVAELKGKGFPVTVIQPRFEVTGESPYLKVMMGTLSPEVTLDKADPLYGPRMAERVDRLLPSAGSPERPRAVMKWFNSALGQWSRGESREPIEQMVAPLEQLRIGVDRLSKDGSTGVLMTPVRPADVDRLSGQSLGKKDFEIFSRIVFGPEQGRADSNAFFVFKGGNLPGAAEYQKEVLRYLESLGYEVHPGTNVLEFGYDKQFVYWPEAYALQLIQGPGRDRFAGEPGYQEFIEDMKLGYSYVQNKEYEKFQEWFREALKKPGLYQKDIGLKRQEFMTEVFNAGGASVWVRRKATRRDILEKLGLLDKWAVIQKPDGTYSYIEDEALKTVFGEQDPKKIAELAKKEKLTPGWVFQAPEQTFFKYVVGGSADSGRKAHAGSIRNRFWREVEKGRFDTYLNSVAEREKAYGVTLWEGDTKRVFTLFWNMVHLPYADEFKEHMALTPRKDIQAWLRIARSTAGKAPPDFEKWVDSIPSRPRLKPENIRYIRDQFFSWWGEAVRMGVPEDSQISAIETYIRLTKPWFMETAPQAVTDEDVQWIWNYFSDLYGGVHIGTKRQPGTYEIRDLLMSSKDPGAFLERLGRWIKVGTEKLALLPLMSKHPNRVVLGFLYGHQEAFRRLLQQVGTGKGDPEEFWSWVNGSMRIAALKTKAAIDRLEISDDKFNEDFLKNLDIALANVDGLSQRGQSLGKALPDDLRRMAAVLEEEKKSVDRLSPDGSMPSARLADLDGLSQQGQSLGEIPPDDRLGKIIEEYNGPGDIYQWSEQQYDEAIQLIERAIHQTLVKNRWKYRELILGPEAGDRMPDDLDVEQVIYDGIPVYQGQKMIGVFLPSDIRELIAMFRALKIPKGTSYLSLGSGLGSDAIVAALFGLDVTMAEIDPRLLELSREVIRDLSEGEKALLRNVTIHGERPVDYLSNDLKFTPFKAIYYFDRGLAGSDNWKRLDQKLKSEMSQDAALLVYQENVWNKNAKTFSQLKQVAVAEGLGRFRGLSSTHNFLSVYQRPDGAIPEYIKTFDRLSNKASTGGLTPPVRPADVDRLSGQSLGEIQEFLLLTGSEIPRDEVLSDVLRVLGLDTLKTAFQKNPQGFAKFLRSISKDISLFQDLSQERSLGLIALRTALQNDPYGFTEALRSISERTSLLQALSQESILGWDVMRTGFQNDPLGFAEALDSISKDVSFSENFQALAEEDSLGLSTLRTSFLGDPRGFAVALQAVSGRVSLFRILSNENFLSLDALRTVFLNDPYAFANALQIISKKAGFQNTFDLLIDTGIDRDTLQRYFAVAPANFVFTLQALRALKNISLPSVSGDGEIDLGRFLKEQDKRLVMRVYEVASINAAEGMMRAFKLQPEQTAILYEKEVTEDLARSRFPGHEIRDVGSALKPGELDIEFHDGGNITVGQFGLSRLFLPYGFFKYNLPEPLSEEERGSLRNAMQLSKGREVWVVSSPNPTEVRSVIEAYSKEDAAKRPLLILGLRQEDRALKAALIKEGYSVLNRDPEDQDLKLPFNGRAEGKPMGNADIIVLNTKGELLKLFALADIPLVGQDRNLMEPVSQGNVPLYFPGDWSNNHDLLEFLKLHGAAEEVKDLSRQIADRRDPGEAGRMKARAQETNNSFQNTLMPANRFFAAALVLAQFSSKAAAVSPPIEGKSLGQHFPPDFIAKPDRSVGGEVKLAGPDGEQTSYYKIESAVVPIDRYGFSIATELNFKVIETFRPGDKSPTNITLPRYMLAAYGKDPKNGYVKWYLLPEIPVDENQPLLIYRGLRLNQIGPDDMDLEPKPVGREARILVSWKENGFKDRTIYLPRDLYTATVSRSYWKDRPDQGSRQNPRRGLHSATQEKFNDYNQPGHVEITLLRDNALQISDLGSFNGTQVHELKEKLSDKARPNVSSLEVSSSGAPSIFMSPEDVGASKMLSKILSSDQEMVLLPDQKFSFDPDKPFSVRANVAGQLSVTNHFEVKNKELYLIDPDGTRTLLKEGNFSGEEVPVTGQSFVGGFNMSKAKAYEIFLYREEGIVSVRNYSAGKVTVRLRTEGVQGASLGKDINVFGGGEFQADHPLVKAGRIIKVADYQNIDGVNLVEYAKRLRKEQGVERIYMDLDLTVFRAMGYLSSSKWFENVHDLYGIGNTLGWWGDAGHEARQIANGFFFRLMDPKLPEMIRELRDSKFEIVGLTARAPRDQERTEKLLKGLGLELDNVLYTGGAGNKGPVLDGYETIKGPAKGLIIEDSFKNLEGLLSERSGLSGIYYESPTSHLEDSWTYRDYLGKAEDALKAEKWGYAFEYYYNAAIKIFELKDLAREEAYGEFEKIYQNLTGKLKDKNLEGYKTLETIVDIARKPEKESIYYQDARGRAAWEKRQAKSDALSAGLSSVATLGNEQWANALGSLKEIERYRTVQEILQSGNAELAKDLLKDPDPLVRGNAALILTQWGLEGAPVAIREALTQESDWVTAQIMIQSLVTLGEKVPEDLPLIENWNPNQTSRVTEILTRLIEKMKSDGHENNLIRIIGWKSSYARNAWMIGHDVDFLRVFYQDLPPEKVKEYEDWLDAQLLRVGAMVQPKILNEGDGLKTLETRNYKNDLIYVPLYEPGKGFLIQDSPIWMDEKYVVRQKLFEHWAAGDLPPPEKRLIQRIQAMLAFEMLYDVPKLNLSPEEFSLLPTLQSKGLIRTTVSADGKITAVMPRWGGEIGKAGDMRPDPKRIEVAHMEQKDGTFDLKYDMTTDGGDRGGFWWKIAPVRIGKSIIFDFDVTEGADREFALEFADHEQLVGQINVELPGASGEFKVSTQELAGIKIDQINVVFSKGTATRGRIQLSNFKVPDPSGAENPVSFKGLIPITVHGEGLGREVITDLDAEKAKLVQRIKTPLELQKEPRERAELYIHKLLSLWESKGLFIKLRDEKGMSHFNSGEVTAATFSLSQSHRLTHVILATDTPGLYRDLFLVDEVPVGYGGFSYRSRAKWVSLSFRIFEDLIQPYKTPGLPREIFIDRLEGIYSRFEGKIDAFTVDAFQTTNHLRAPPFYRKTFFEAETEDPVIFGLVTDLFRGKTLDQGELIALSKLSNRDLTLHLDSRVNPELVKVFGQSLGSETFRPIYQMHPDKSIEDAVNEAIRGDYGIIAVPNLELGNRVKAYLSQKKLGTPLEIVGMDPRAFNVYKLSDLEQLEKIFKSSDVDSRIASYHRLADLNARGSRKVLQLLIEALGREKDPRALPTLIHLIDQTTNPGIGRRWSQVIGDYQERQKGNVKAVEPLRQELTVSSLKRTDSLFMENLDHFEAEALELAEVQRAIQDLQLNEAEQLLANLAYNTKSRAHTLYLSRKERAGVPFQRIVYYSPVPYGSLDISAMNIQILDLESPKVLIDGAPVVEGGKWMGTPSLENQTALHQYLDEHDLKTVKQRIDWGEQFSQYFRQYGYDPNRFSWDEFAEQEKLPSKEPPAFVEYVRSGNDAEIFKFNVTQPYRLMGLATHLFEALLTKEKGIDRVRFNNFQTERDRAFIQSLVSRRKIYGPYEDALGSYFTLKPLKIDITELSRFSHDLALTLDPAFSYEKRAREIADAFDVLITKLGLENKFAFYFAELDEGGDLKQSRDAEGAVSQYWRSVERRGLEGKSRMSDTPGLFTGEKKVFEEALRRGAFEREMGTFKNDFWKIDSRQDLPDGVREDQILEKDRQTYGEISDKITYGAFRWFDKGEILGIFWMMGDVSEEDREILNMARVLISQVLAKSFQLEVLRRYSANVALSQLELERINQVHERTRILADKVHQSKGALALLEKRLTEKEFESARTSAVQINQQVEGLSKKVEGYLKNLTEVQKELWDAETRIGTSFADIGSLRGNATPRVAISPELAFYSKVIQARTSLELDLIDAENKEVSVENKDQILQAASQMVREIANYQVKLDEIQSDKEKTRAVLGEIEGQITEMTALLANFVNTFTDEWLDQNLSSIIETLLKEKNYQDPQKEAAFRARTSEWIRNVIKTIRSAHRELLELLQDTAATQQATSFDAVQAVQKVFQEESARGDESGISYEWTSSLDKYELISDPSVVKDTVVRALLDNAAKAIRHFRETAPGEKKIALSVEPHDSYLKVRVKDTGPGFDWSNPEVREKLFTLGGKQLSQGSEKNEVSTGLGLALAQSRLRVLGGELYLEETAKGKGSVFSVLLPRLPLQDSNLAPDAENYQLVLERINQKLQMAGEDSEEGLRIRLIRDQLERAWKGKVLTRLFFDDAQKVLGQSLGGAVEIPVRLEERAKMPDLMADAYFKATGTSMEELEKAAQKKLIEKKVAPYFFMPEARAPRSLFVVLDLASLPADKDALVKILQLTGEGGRVFPFYRDRKDLEKYRALLPVLPAELRTKLLEAKLVTALTSKQLGQIQSSKKLGDLPLGLIVSNTETLAGDFSTLSKEEIRTFQFAAKENHGVLTKAVYSMIFTVLQTGEIPDMHGKKDAKGFVLYQFDLVKLAQELTEAWAARTAILKAA